MSLPTNYRHGLLKIALILFLVGFVIDLTDQFAAFGPWTNIFILVAFIGISVIILLLNYRDMQRFGFLMILLAALHQIYRHMVLENMDMEFINYIGLVFIALYFILRSKKTKYSKS